MRTDPKKQREYAKKYYQKNRALCIERALAAKRKIKRKIVAYKMLHPCQCGEDHPAALDFHHDKGKKEFCIGSSIAHSLPWNKIKQEILKCRVICRNCHSKLHWGHTEHFTSLGEAQKEFDEPIPIAHRHPMLESTKEKIAAKMRGRESCWKGKKLSSETRAKMSKSHTGKRFSDAHRLSLSEALKGRKLSPEHRLAISKAKR